MGFQMQMPHHFKLDSSNIKVEPFPNESPLSSLAQHPSEPLLPSISEWYNDGSDSRRSSTSSLASSWALVSEGQSPVDAIGDLDQHERGLRALHRLNQSPVQMITSPYPSPGSTPGPEDHVVQKSKTKAKTRSVRGVAHASDASNKDLTPEEKERMKAKAEREINARFEQSLSLARAWQELLITNSDFIREGVTKDGKKGLRRLKSNNIDERIKGANEINKDQVVDLHTICHRQLREMNIRQIENHRRKGRYDEALELERELRGVGTHL